ncbi:MAG: response regulator [Thermomicrobiales bacterium]|nr:response regulator [Thermomicrobiales bacterium]
MTSQHVLVVEDSPETLALLRRVFEAEGFRVTTNSAPPDAAAVAREAPDLVVLDVLFGREQRGLDLLRELRADAATADLPVVLCSAAIEPLRRIEGDLLVGGVGLVLKPFDIDALLDEVARVTKDAEQQAGAHDGPRARGDLAGDQPAAGNSSG